MERSKKSVALLYKKKTDNCLYLSLKKINVKKKPENEGKKTVF